MCILEKYNAALTARAQEQHMLAMQARENGDEREQSIRLMVESMCGDMLRALGQTQHANPKAPVMQQLRDHALQEEARMNAKEDYDGADRARIKAETIGWAMAVLEGLEKDHAE